MQTEILGNTQSIALQNNTLVIKTNETEARIMVYSPTVIRVCISKAFHITDKSFAVIQQPLATLDYQESEDEIEINTSSLKLRITKSPLRFNFYTANGKALSQDDKRFGTNWQDSRVINYRKLYPDEKFMGLGEKTGNLNRRGSSYVNWNTDA
ncbi:MAG TPA: glycoside hydrolase family 31, partial [Mucilaginibacter sp.]